MSSSIHDDINSVTYSKQGKKSSHLDKSTHICHLTHCGQIIKNGQFAKLSEMFGLKSINKEPKIFT